ncbi:Uncharacterised protein [Nocardia farcinica]|nr:Uncharacterised protein [Nocardia farcinica]
MIYSHLTKRQLKRLAREYGRAMSKHHREYAEYIGMGLNSLADSRLQRIDKIVKTLGEIGKELELRG